MHKSVTMVQTWRCIMKALVAALALATLIAAPTFAHPANAAPMSPSSSSFSSNCFLLTTKPDQQPKVSDRATPLACDFRDGYRIDDGFQPDELVPHSHLRRRMSRILQARRLPNELSLQTPHLEFSFLPARDTSPDARN